jgi:hypothetical protein
MRSKIGAVIVGSALGLGFACGGSDGTDVTGALPGTDGAAPIVTTPTATDKGPARDRDAASDAATVEGGSNIDPDGGTDLLPDGGKCNDIDQRGGLVTSTCSSTAEALSGGKLVAGTYRLTAVTALGSLAFCRNQFVPTGFRETLELTDGTLAFVVQAVADVATLPRRRTTSTFTPFPGDTSPLTAREICPESKGATGVQYESVTDNGKTRLTLVLPYGRGIGVYRFEKE